MTDCNELAVVQALAARVARINGTGDYSVDINGNVPVQRIDFDSQLDEMPLVGVVLQSAKFIDQGTSPRFPAEEAFIEIVGCIKRGDDRTSALALLMDMRHAVLDEPDGGDVISECCTSLRLDSFEVFLATSSEAFSQVSLYLTARWDGAQEY